MLIGNEKEEAEKINWTLIDCECSPCNWIVKVAAVAYADVEWQIIIFLNCAFDDFFLTRAIGV